MTSEGALGWAIASFVVLQAVALAAIVVLVIATRSQGDRITRIERPTPKAQRQAIRRAIRNLPPDAARALLSALLENATRAQRAQLRAAVRSRPSRRTRPGAATPSAPSSSTTSTSHPPAAANRAPRPTRPKRPHKARAPAPSPPPASSSAPPPTSSPPPRPPPPVNLPPGPAGITLCIPPLGGLGCA